MKRLEEHNKVGYVGEIRMFAFPHEPRGWARADGQRLPIKDYPELFSLIGTTYGGGGGEFCLPDMRGRVPLGCERGEGAQTEAQSPYRLGAMGGSELVKLKQEELPPHTHQFRANKTVANASDPSGAIAALVDPDNRSPPAQPNLYGLARDPDQSVRMAAASITDGSEFGLSGSGHDNMQPYSVFNFCICREGFYPDQLSQNVASPDDSRGQFVDPYPFVGEIRLFLGNRPPRGWLFCQGQELDLRQDDHKYAMLWSVLDHSRWGGTPYTFMLPDLRGQVPIHMGEGKGLSPRYMGPGFGKAEVPLERQNIPPHSHALMATKAPATTSVPSSNVGFASVTLRAGPHNALTPVAYVNKTGGGQERTLSASSIDATGPNPPTAHPNLMQSLPLHFIIAYMGQPPFGMD